MYLFSKVAKNNYIVLIYKICTVVVLVFYFVTFVYAEVITIGIHERPFYREKTSAGKWKGIDIELVKAIFEEAKLDYQLTEYPWSRTLQAIESGKVDMALSAAKTPEREKFAWFSSTSFRLGHNVLYIDKQKQAKFNSVDTLDGVKGTDLKLGVIRGISYSDRYDELLEDKAFVRNLVILDSTVRLPSMLLKGRIDGYLDSEYGGTFRVNDNPLFSERITVRVYVTSESEAQTYLMFSKASVNKTDMDNINMALKKINENGIYKQIVARYGLLSRYK